MNKKANLAHNWVEYFFLGLGIVGFIIAVRAKTPFLNYLTIIICGLLGGRFIYKLRNSLRLTLYLLFMGFLVGYILGSTQASRKLVLIFFVVSCFVSYYSHIKDYIKV